MIEAIQLDAADINKPLPFWGEAEYRSHPMAHTEIKTLEGWYRVHDGDWIVKGIKGEFYPVRADIFDETYEKVAD